ncbi:MAG: dehydratase [Candidatus Rokubacteria bacterium]|nr:dehydratase [Candidatus Rokubacteria bacterium]
MMIHRVGGDVNDFGEAIALGLAGLGPLPERLGLAFHTDEAAAARSIYGGLLASGWHTGSLAMRILYDGLLKNTASLGSPGIDELRWLKPVRPGDTLSLRMTILATIPSRTRLDSGLVRSLMEMRNQRGEVVLTIRGLSLLGRRPA